MLRAWTCSAKSNVELINNLMSAHLIHQETVAEAMRKVDRANYCRIKSAAYEDSPQTIGHSATISAPHMHANATENLLNYLKPGNKVLDVGSGSGYSCAVFHHLVGKDGVVVGIDHVDGLVQDSVNNLRNDGLDDAINNGSIQMITGDGRKGYSDQAPYHAIHVGAAAPKMPQELIDQLAKPGRLFVPVEDSTNIGQTVWQVDKDINGEISKKGLMSVMYVPLTSKEFQLGRT